MVAISHRESAKAAQRCRAIYYLNFVRHTPLNSVNVKSMSNAILIDRKHISVHQALFLCAGYQATP